MGSSRISPETIKDVILGPVSFPRLTRDLEHRIIVSALHRVISNQASDTSSASSLTEVSSLLPLPDAGMCPICGMDGCKGCSLIFPPNPREEEEEEKGSKARKEKQQHTGVRRRPSGKWSAEIWDPSSRKRRWLGTFQTAEMAARAYHEADVRLAGNRSEKRRTKLPPSEKQNERVNEMGASSSKQEAAEGLEIFSEDELRTLLEMD